MNALPFKFFHKDDSAFIYTAKRVDADGRVVITWDAPNDKGNTTYGQDAVEQHIAEGAWVVVGHKIDLRTTLKIKLFEMRIADMEASLAALKQEFEFHKQDVKGLH